MAGDRNGPLSLRQRNIGELPGAIHGEVDILLVGLPGLSRLRQESDEVLVGILVVAAGEGVSVVQHAKVSACFRPDIVRFGGMNVRVVAAGSGQDVGVGRGVSGLFADVDDGAVDHGSGRAIHQAVDEGGVGILINLLDAAGELIGRLGPVVILHRDHEHGLDLLGMCGESARCCEKGTHSQRTEKSGVRHENLQGRICAVSCGGTDRIVRLERRTLRLPRDNRRALQNGNGNITERRLVEEISE